MKVALVFVSILLSACASYFYYPSDQTYYDPKWFRSSFEEVFFSSSMHTNLHGWWFPAKTKDNLGTIIVFHGNAQNITSHFSSFVWLPNQGYSFLIFDYPGYGKSKGTPSAEGTVLAGIAATQWVHENKDQRPLILYGQSLGGIVAMRVANEINGKIPLRALVADSSFDSYEKMGQAVLGRFWLSWPFQWLPYFLLSDRWAPHIEAISPTPMLIISGEKDPVVPPFFADRIYSQAKEPKTMWKITNAGHIQTFWTEDGIYRQRFVDYLSSLSK